jgi:uncharacterized cupin superfamily protein
MPVRLRAPMAEVEETPEGDVPRGDGWYVLNARRARWLHAPGFGGSDCSFQGDVRFDEVGFHLGVLQPGEPACMYHRENHQEGFLVLSGECLAIVEGEEVPLHAWDFFHCPAGVAHVLVGAGDGPCTVIAFGGRTGEDRTSYLPDPVARRHGAAVDVETCDPNAAYAETPTPVPGPAPDF